MSSDRAQLGRAAEDAACAYLESLGLRIMRRNLRGPGGEIDIVAAEGETIVFIEVKARSGRGFGSAVAAVNAAKRRRIRAVAQDFLQFVAPQAQARFDVLAIDSGRMTLHRNAFG